MGLYSKDAVFYFNTGTMGGGQDEDNAERFFARRGATNADWLRNTVDGFYRDLFEEC